LPDHRQHLRYVLCGAWLVIGRQYAQRALVGMHFGDETFGQRSGRLAVLGCALNDLVVDVRNVSHVFDVIAVCPQPARHHVEHHEHPRMTQMAQVVDGHAADIHADPARHERDESFL
jgi:hypothetical protein